MSLNSATWDSIADSPLRLQVPVSLYKILESYFQNRVLVYNTDEGRKSIHITAGIPQDPILGLVLWNVVYDEVLKLKFPAGVKIVRFADDHPLEVYDKSIEEVELTAVHSIDVVEDRMRSRKLELAFPKTEVIVVNNRMSEQHATIRIGDCTRYYLKAILETLDGDDRRQANVW